MNIYSSIVKEGGCMGEIRRVMGWVCGLSDTDGYRIGLCGRKRGVRKGYDKALWEIKTYIF